MHQLRFRIHYPECIVINFTGILRFVGARPFVNFDTTQCV